MGGCWAGGRVGASTDLPRRLNRRVAGCTLRAMDLVEVHFQDAGKTVFVQPGTTLLAAAAMAEVEILTGCTRGMCGTDATQVRCEPAGALESPSEPEAGTLSRMGFTVDATAATGTACRMLCSAKVCQGKITVLGDAIG